MNTHRQHNRHPGIRRLGITFAGLGLVFAVGACSTDPEQSSGSDRTAFGSQLAGDRPESSTDHDAPPGPHIESESEVAPDGSVPEPSSPEGPGTSTDSNQGGGEAGAASERRRTAPGERSVIQTGVVSVASDEVGNARFDAKEIIDRHAGEIAEEETGTSDGEVTRVRMVVRVPHQAFDELMTDFGELGELRSATRSSEDVSTQVIDTRSRVKSQERSIARIQALLAEAESISDVVSIESQLASRQADLDSLKSQLAWLEDQSSLSTVTLSLVESSTAQEEEDEETGFLAGLRKGWDGLGSAATGVATALGTVLPFSALLAALLIPVWLLLRRRLRRQPSAPGTPA